MKIAVAGATSRVGRHVVDVVKAAGLDVVPMSRASGVDVVTGTGLGEALAGVECVIDAATGPSPEQGAATEFFTAAARRGDALRIEAVSDPADPDRDVFEKGGLLPGPDAILAGPTFDEWLDSAS